MFIIFILLGIARARRNSDAKLVFLDEIAIVANHISNIKRDIYSKNDIFSLTLYENHTFHSYDGKVCKTTLKGCRTTRYGLNDCDVSRF